MPKVLLSNHRFVEASWTLIASSDQLLNRMFWTMTLRSESKLSPPPVNWAPELPMMVVFDPTLTMPERAIVPLTRTILALEPATAEVNAEAEETVVVGPPEPPVVPPFMVA